MGSKYILIIMVVTLRPVIYYLLLLFIFPKCSVMSMYYFYNLKRSHIGVPTVAQQVKNPTAAVV